MVLRDRPVKNAKTVEGPAICEHGFTSGQYTGCSMSGGSALMYTIRTPCHTTVKLQGPAGLLSPGST